MMVFFPTKRARGTKENLMPVYNCYRGHAEGIALEKEGCFVLQDLRGRDWFCFESSIPSLAGVDREALIKERAQEMSERIARLWGLGLKSPHSACTVVDCANMEELRKLLSDSKDAEDHIRETQQGQGN
jgi:hypothetical protein